MEKRFKVIELTDLGDERGGLNVIEANKQVPFEIKRIFYDYNTDENWVRGNHANKNSKFAFVSVAGRCRVDVDDGINKEMIVLDSPNKMLIIDKMVWKIMKDFSRDNVLLIISDNAYDGSEYVGDYEEFLHYIKNIE